MSTRIAFFNDEYVALENANVNILNQTFMYGLGVFEGIRGYWNAEHKQIYLFRLREHIERMFDMHKDHAPQVQIQHRRGLRNYLRTGATQ
jgi:branched-subunit amino acid aminotransferase/4-amino-4-deoxychorismate lyase